MGEEFVVGDVKHGADVLLDRLGEGRRYRGSHFLHDGLVVLAHDTAQKYRCNATTKGAIESLGPPTHVVTQSAKTAYPVAHGRG